MLRSRVSGEVVGMAPGFIDGGLLTEGEAMLTIDPIDYELALAQSESALEKARFDYKIELGRQDVAKREWELLKPEGEISDLEMELALRTPHLKASKAALQAAEANLKKADLNLERTRINAPFNAVVVQRKTDLGAQASLQDALAMLAGSDQFYVRASIPLDQLRWIKCDPVNGSVATITRNTGDIRTGRAVRMESAIEEKGRMARVLIAVDHPLQGEYPMLLNEYVRISIEGAPIESAYRIPRSALHEDRLVWIATDKGTLEIRAVAVNWRDATDVLISGGVEDGERLILTNLSGEELISTKSFQLTIPAKGAGFCLRRDRYSEPASAVDSNCPCQPRDRLT